MNFICLPLLCLEFVEDYCAFRKKRLRGIVNVDPFQQSYSNIHEGPHDSFGAANPTMKHFSRLTASDGVKS